MEEHDVPVALLTDDLVEEQEHFFANLVLGSTTLSVRIDTDQVQINIMDESGTV